MGFDSQKDYYKVLGVAQSASAEEIDRAFRSEARKRHPDGGGSEEAMKALNEAHDVLGDSELRAAYDAERRPSPRVYGSSMAFDPEAASEAGTLKIPVSDEDFAGLAMGAGTCIGLSLPLLLLVEMQWVFFLWPLRFIALGTLVAGLYMAHAALNARHRHFSKIDNPLNPRTIILHKIVFWAIATAVVGLLAAYYAS